MTTVPVQSTDQAGLRKVLKKVVAPAVLILLGLIVLIYPVVSTEWNNWQQTRAAAEYAQIQRDIPSHIVDQQWEDAHLYNKNRVTGLVLDPWIERFITDNQAYEDYLSELDSTEAMARLILPSAKVDLPVYHGTQEDALLRGVGHIFGSDLPVGGPGSHSVLTGHTGLPTSTLFDNLTDVKEDDSFFIQVAGHKLKYQVDEIRIVLPNEVESLRRQPGEDLVTLVTCTPYGINTHRLIVRGHRVPIAAEEKARLDESQGRTWQWWMYLLSALFILGVLLLCFWLSRQTKRIRQQLNRDVRHTYESEQ